MVLRYDWTGSHPEVAASVSRHTLVDSLTGVSIPHIAGLTGTVTLGTEKVLIQVRSVVPEVRFYLPALYVHKHYIPKIFPSKLSEPDQKLGLQLA